VSPIIWPPGWRIERLNKSQQRKNFRSGQAQVDDWFRTKALQNQDKQLSITKVLLDGVGEIAGFFTLAMGQIDFSDLPLEVVKKLPRRALPIAVIAWLGVRENRRGQGLGQRLFAQALRDCFDASQTFAFIAVIVDCVDGAAKAFYQQFGFAELPGHPYRLFVTSNHLAALMEGP
jgi:ribosomal protein S18 acetylase RimI-like enzyme